MTTKYQTNSYALSNTASSFFYTRSRIIDGRQGNFTNLYNNGLMLQRPLIHPKLKISHPGNKYEQEADLVADEVMRTKDDELQESPLKITGVERQSEESAENVFQVFPYLESCINAVRGKGQPLFGPVRTFFESRFGHDFSNVRVHTNVDADDLNWRLNACAFTTGQDIFFQKGAYHPHSSNGRYLLAHELTHVVQQSGGNNHPQTVNSTIAKDKNTVMRVQSWRSGQPAEGWSLRKAAVTLRWSKDLDTFYHCLIYALRKKPDFAGLPNESLNVFRKALKHFLTISCGEACAKISEGKPVRLLARAWADPAGQRLADNAVIGLALLRLGRATAEGGYKHEEKGKRKAEAAGVERPTEQEIVEFVPVTPEELEGITERWLPAYKPPWTENQCKTWAGEDEVVTYYRELAGLPYKAKQYATKIRKYCLDVIKYWPQLSNKFAKNSYLGELEQYIYERYWKWRNNFAGNFETVARKRGPKAGEELKKGEMKQLFVKYTAFIHDAMTSRGGVEIKPKKGQHLRRR